MFARARPAAPFVPAARATARPFVQRKAMVGRADDAAEREADAVADRVTRAGDAGSVDATPPAIRRRCAACDDEREIRRRAAHDGDAALDADTAELTASRGGAPLPAAVRAQFEPRFGRDFSDVRVHTDAEAAHAARGVRAQAYAFGSHIVFGAGQFAPHTASGRHLIAHELAHVVQQGGGTAHVRRKTAPEYVVDEAYAGRYRPGAPVRINFARGSAAIPASEQAKIDGFKSGFDRPRPLELLGLATADELAVSPTLPRKRAEAVDAALAVPEKGEVPFVLAHIGPRKITAGTAANTKDTPRLAFDRAVEILRPGEVGLNPSSPTAAPTMCNPTIEKDFQDARTMAFDWIDVTRADLVKRPVPAGIAGSLDQFFGDHNEAIATRVDGNLGLIRKEVESLAKAANHNCADPKDPGCVGAIASNSGGVMKICASYSGMTPEDRARNLVHEAGHSTAGLALTGKRKRSDTDDVSYRYERGIDRLGKMNLDQALSNSDSYSMLLMTERVPLSITKGMRPVVDPAPAGFVSAGDIDAAQRAVILAERWLRLADQGIKDLHGELRGAKGKPVPRSVGIVRVDKILGEAKKRFPPILSGKDVTDDDLAMLAGVLDRYQELERLFDLAIAIVPGATTAFTARAAVAPAKAGTLSLTVDRTFLAAKERARARKVVDAAIELVSTARIPAARRGDYGAFAEFVRELFQ